MIWIPCCAMKEEQQSLLLNSCSRFPLPQGSLAGTSIDFIHSSNSAMLLLFLMVWMFAGVKLSYGTSGFRADASVLSSTVYRVGILAALRSLKTESVIGVMITASHNIVSDNGVKVADPNGSMLSQHWEPFADALANAPSPQHLLQVSKKFSSFFFWACCLKYLMDTCITTRFWWWRNQWF